MKLLQQFWHYSTQHKKIAIPALIVFLILVIIFRPKPHVPVPTQKAEYTTLTQSLSVTGSVAAKHFINLTFPASGTIAYVGVKKGDTVAAGQTIATLDQRTTLKTLQNALIDFSKQRNTYDQTIQNNNNISSPSDALSDSMKRVLENNQYDLQKAANSVELADIAKQQSVLTTPIAGLVTRADTEVAGTTAVAGTTTFTVTDPTSIAFDMDVDQSDIGKVQVGQPVKIVLDAYPNDPLFLTVKSIDFVSHTTASGGSAYTVEAALPANSPFVYRVGMNGSADITTAQKNHVLTIPIASLVNDTYVYVQTSKGFEKRKVTLGLQSDIDTEVITGLKAGDIIAVDPTQIAKSK